MRVYPAGPITADGGTIFICEGLPNAGIDWQLTGNGVLTPSETRCDSNGIATASYDPTAGTPASAYESITVQAVIYAP